VASTQPLTTVPPGAGSVVSGAVSIIDMPTVDINGTVPVSLDAPLPVVVNNDPTALILLELRRISMQLAVLTGFWPESETLNDDLGAFADSE